MSVSETVWDLEPHTLKKHEILRRYFQAWLPIMAKWNQRVLYIDGFAGPGEYSQGEDGSPVTVLKAARDHKYPFKSELICLFVEKDQKRYEHLLKVLRVLEPTLPGNIKYQVVHGTFNEHLTQVLKFLDEQKKLIAPTFAFVDPFGFSHTPFSTIERILQNQRCEVLVNFMYEDINRFLGHPDHPGTFDELFGSRLWHEALDAASPDERRRKIHSLYLRQLRRVANHVRSFEMLNRGNKTDYFLFFATKSLLGLEKMKEAMWAIDPSGAFQFSDYTDSLGQIALFASSPDYEVLRGIIIAQFGGKRIDIRTLEEWVISETPFLRTHIRKNVLVPMEKEGTVSLVDPKPDRRKGTYPDGTLLKFS